MGRPGHARQGIHLHILKTPSEPFKAIRRGRPRVPGAFQGRQLPACIGLDCPVRAFSFPGSRMSRPTVETKNPPARSTDVSEAGVFTRPTRTRHLLIAL